MGVNVCIKIVIFHWNTYKIKIHGEIVINSLNQK